MAQSLSIALNELSTGAVKLHIVIVKKKRQLKLFNFLTLKLLKMIKYNVAIAIGHVEIIKR